MTDQERIKSAQARQAMAEARELDARIRFAVLSEKLRELELAAAWRAHRDAEAAVLKLVQLGKMGKHDLVTQMQYLRLFNADPSLVELADPPPQKKRSLL